MASGLSWASCAPSSPLFEPPGNPARQVPVPVPLDRRGHGGTEKFKVNWFEATAGEGQSQDSGCAAGRQTVRQMLMCESCGVPRMGGSTEGERWGGEQEEEGSEIERSSEDHASVSLVLGCGGLSAAFSRDSRSFCTCVSSLHFACNKKGWLDAVDFSQFHIKEGLRGWQSPGAPFLPSRWLPGVTVPLPAPLARSATPPPSGHLPA